MDARVKEFIEKKKTILNKLPGESADLIRKVSNTTPLGHANEDEIKAILDLYGGSGSGFFIACVAFEAGYIRGSRTGTQTDEKDI